MFVQTTLYPRFILNNHLCFSTLVVHLLKQCLRFKGSDGAVSWVAYAALGVTPQYLTAGEARKEVNLKIPRGQKAKPVVLQFVLDNDPTFSVQYTKHGNPKPGAYDRADSWIIAKAGWSRWKKQQSSAES